MNLQTTELKALFIKAYTILTASVLRAEKLRNEAKNIKRTNNVKLWIDRMNKKDELLRRADIVENRGRKIWASVGDYQGKYVNWRNVTNDGDSIYFLWVNTTDQYNAILPTAKKIA